MRKTLWIIIALILIIAIAAFAAIMIINNDYSDNDRQAKGRNNQESNVRDNILNNSIEIVETQSMQEKVSPNCTFIFKTYYSKCDHIKLEKESVSETMVNKTKEELEKIFKNWQIVTFRSDEVLFYKEEEAICGEHYMLREENNTIAIYTIDENNNESLKETTAIVTTYLPQEDLNRLKVGIGVSGKEELNRVLEDFE